MPPHEAKQVLADAGLTEQDVKGSVGVFDMISGGTGKRATLYRHIYGKTAPLTDVMPWYYYPPAKALGALGYEFGGD